MKYIPFIESECPIHFPKSSTQEENDLKRSNSQNEINQLLISYMYQYILLYIFIIIIAVDVYIVYMFFFVCRC